MVPEASHLLSLHFLNPTQQPEWSFETRCQIMSLLCSKSFSSFPWPWEKKKNHSWAPGDLLPPLLTSQTSSATLSPFILLQPPWPPCYFLKSPHVYMCVQGPCTCSSLCWSFLPDWCMPTFRPLLGVCWNVTLTMCSFEQERIYFFDLLLNLQLWQHSIFVEPMEWVNRHVKSVWGFVVHLI